MNYRDDLKSYITGFALSILFTIIAFVAVMQNLFAGNTLTLVLIVLGVFQAIVQLVFFLHLKPWAKPEGSQQEQDDAKWNLATLVLTVGLILIVVVGALWIMSHLNYNMMPMEIEHRMMKMENIFK